MIRFFKFLAIASILALAWNSCKNRQQGLHVQNGHLYEAYGNRFIIRGINYPHAWFPENTDKSIPAIAATGANTVRVVLSNGERWHRNSEAEVANIIDLCKAHNLIAVLEVHDCTGWGDSYNEPLNAAHISTATNYWISIKNALIGQEDFVIINIANEPHGNGVSANDWQNDWITAIQALREAGLRHNIMVDAANWGQDWQGFMKERAPAIMAADPEQNLTFSVHMYEVYSDAKTAESYMDAFVSNGLPLVIGEFAASHFQHPIPAAEIMRLANERGFGYIGWSWSGNSRTNNPATDLRALDIVINNNGQFDHSTLTPWGEILINHKSYGIKATSRPASIFRSN